MIPETRTGDFAKMQRHVRVYLGAGALLIILVCELLFSVQHLSQTYDESVHIYSGWRIWHRDFGVNPEDPPLVKAISALPLLWMNLKEPPIPATGNTKPTDFSSGVKFLYGNDADSILFRSRMTASAWTIMLAVVVFSCAREMFGSAVALVSLMLFVFEPNILAHGALVTTDMGETLFFFTSVYMFWRFIKQPTVVRLLAASCSVVFALTAKHSGLLVLPTIGVLAILELVYRRKTFPVSHEFWKPPRIISHLMRLGISLAVVTAIGFFGLWAAYTFRFAARPEGLPALAPSLDVFARSLENSRQTDALLRLAGMRILPESYLWGLADVFQATDRGRPMFLLGRIYESGRWFYFPFAFLIKSTIPLLLLFCGVAATKAIRARELRREILFLVVPATIYFGFAMRSGLNIGIRHILPIFPFVIVLGGISATRLLSYSRFGKFVLAALLILHATSSLHAYPNYLTYSNEVAGGPSNTHRLLDDSNVDWGQQLKQIGDYIQRRNISNCWFAYMVPVINPKYYGIPCRLLPRTPFYPERIVPRSISGTVFISAFEANGTIWGPDELNPYHAITRANRLDLIANSVLVFEGTFDVPLASALTHSTKGQQLLQQGHSEDGLQELRTAVDLAPNSADIHARLCQALTQISPAEADCECATALSLAQKYHPEYQLKRVASVRAVDELLKGRKR